MPHIHEKIDFTASALIVHNDKILMRKHDKYAIWLFPGGHIELDEDPNEAVTREAKEEVGLDIELVAPQHYCDMADDDSHELIPPLFINRHDINNTHEYIDLMFLAITNTDKIAPEEGESTENIVWMSEEDIQNHPQIRPRAKHYALTALKMM